MIEISIIIPTFQPSNYIVECIDSIVNQDCVLENVEVIIVLNGEKDPYYDYIHAIPGLNKLVTKILYSPYLGVSNARNMGLEYSEGSNVVFLDDDDILSSNFISIGLELVKGFNGDVIIQSNSCSFSDVSGRIVSEDYIANNVISYKNTNNNAFSLYKAKSFFSSSCFKIIPRGVIRNTLFESSLNVSEDALFMFCISKYVANVYVEKSIFYNRRIRNGSALTIKKSKYRLLKNCLKFISHLSKVYFSDVVSFNFVFYLSRVVASFKFLIINLCK